MKRLVIILALVIILLTMPNQDAVRPPTTALEMSQTAVTEQIEEVPEKDTEKADVSKTQEETLVEIEEITETNSELIPTENEGVTEESPAVQETPMKTEELKDAGQGETVECVDEGNQSLVEYRSQPSGQVNPFENAPPAEIVDHPVEDLIGEGEDRPGEGKHF